MNTVDIIFQNAHFVFNCDNSEKLKELAAKVNERAAQLPHNTKNTFDSKVLLLTAILLQEELELAHQKLEEMRQAAQQEIETVNKSLVNTIDKVSTYVENLALHLEQV